MAAYEFVTIWRISAPIETVWNEIAHSELWPNWWKGVEKVVELQKGDEKGVGNVRRYTWKSKLPYSLTFNVKTTRVEPYSLLDGDASGELEGKGIWHLSTERSETVVRIDWQVDTTQQWMKLMAPVAGPLFKWNHAVIMSWGAKGLAKRLGVKVVEQKT